MRNYLVVPIRPLLRLVLPCVVLLTASSLHAQGRGATPMIVVFDSSVRFQDFQQYSAPDEREHGNPRAWGYLNRGVVGAAHYLERRGGFKADHVYSSSIRGFAAKLTPDQVRQLQSDRLVSYIEPDGVASISQQVIPWGISQINGTVDSTISGDGSGAVSGVNVYVIDTGVSSHPDLNKVNHVSFVNGVNDDCNGHGTHVAGTIGAYDNASYVVGVAPGAPITGVKVFDCSGSGTWSNVIKGVDWVTANAVRPAVANMSLEGGATKSVDSAVQQSVASGIFYAVAAGNDGSNACNYSPARAGAGTNNGIMTVAATDQTNAATSWSNYGSCVDIWAPGYMILSTYLNGGTATMSGTSMSTPHAAGTAALYLSRHPGDSPALVESVLRSAEINTGNMTSGTTATKGKASSTTPQAVMLVNAGPF